MSGLAIQRLGDVITVPLNSPCGLALVLLTPVLTVLLLTFAHLCVRLDRAQRRAADEELPPGFTRLRNGRIRFHLSAVTDARRRPRRSSDPGSR